MHEEESTRSQLSAPAQSSDESENPMPNVPFEAIAAVLGLLVLVLVAVAAYSLAESLNAFSVSAQLWAPAVFMLLVAAGFWGVSRYQQRTYTR
jgi:hypothetical protein